MSKNHSEKLTKKQKEAIAEQLAGFFFGFWQNKTNEKSPNIISSNSKAVALDSGLLRNFPEKSKTTT